MSNNNQYYSLSNPPTISDLARRQAARPNPNRQPTLAVTPNPRTKNNPYSPLETETDDDESNRSNNNNNSNNASDVLDKT